MEYSLLGITGLWAHLYRKQRTMTAQMTPKIAAISISACADRWLRGFSSKMSTWLTPADRQPCTLMPIRKMNKVMWKGPRKSRSTVNQSCSSV